MSFDSMIGLLGVYPASIVFLIVFSVTRSPWWKKPLGWVMFGMAASTVLTYTVLVLPALLDIDRAWLAPVRVVAFTLLTAAFIAKTTAVITSRRKKRAQPEEQTR